jgi:hypothetical protein
MTPSITACHYAVCHYAQCRDLFIVLASIIMLNIVMLSVVVLSVVAPYYNIYKLISVDHVVSLMRLHSTQSSL